MKIIDENGLSRLWSKICDKFALKQDLSDETIERKALKQDLSDETAERKALSNKLALMQPTALKIEPWRNMHTFRTDGKLIFFYIAIPCGVKSATFPKSMTVRMWGTNNTYIAYTFNTPPNTYIHAAQLEVMYSQPSDASFASGGLWLPATELNITLNY